MNKKVTLNLKEQKRLLVLNKVLAGRMTGQEAADVLGLSLRHTRRLMAAYRQEGAVVLAHGNRGKRSRRRTPEAVEEEIVALAKGEYHDYNNCHFAEELEERHGITVSSSTLRRIRQRHGLPSPRKRRVPHHRRRQERYPQVGMLLQVDGSKHDWLEGRGPWLTLHAAIDDATNEIPWAIFRETEDATGYALLIHHISQTHGLPLARYVTPIATTMHGQVRNKVHIQGQSACCKCHANNATNKKSPADIHRPGFCYLQFYSLLVRQS